MHIDMGEIEKTIKMVSGLKQSLNSYKSEVARASCDKYDLGFNKDSRFSSWKGEVSLDSWLGYYGSSSCSIGLSIGDKDAFSRYFLKVLNEKVEEILERIISLASDDIAEERQQVLDKLEVAKRQVEALTGKEPAGDQ